LTEKGAVLYDVTKGRPEEKEAGDAHKHTWMI